jgi:cytochrome c biogenesis protein CcmG, thiol:disulfide interchange protein DsbE
MTSEPRSGTLKTKLLVLVLGVGLVAIVLSFLDNMRSTQSKLELEARARESVGTTMPEFSMPVLQQPGKQVPQTMGKRELLGGHYVLHGWASWCLRCRDEHPAIREFVKRHRVRLIGYNVNDEPEPALRWLARYGDPYEFSLVQAAEDSPGVIPLTMTPQLLLIDHEGVVRWRFIGAVELGILEKDLLPLLRQMEGRR